MRSYAHLDCEPGRLSNAHIPTSRRNLQLLHQMLIALQSSKSS